MSRYEKIFDYHVHERHSQDARNTTVRDIVKAAEAKGVTEIAFTTHLVTGGVDHDFGIQPNQMTEYLDEIYDAREATDVVLRAGFEVDYFPEEERNIERILDEHPLDFVLGSVHRVNGLSIATRGEAETFFKGRPLQESINEYLGVWNEAITSGLFDVMAHPDYFKKYLPAMGYPSLKFSDFTPKIYDSFDKLSAYKVGFEVNTSSTRHGSGTFFPVADFVREARIAGVRRVTVGSDTHTPDTLGLNISKAVGLLEASGYDRLSVFRGRREIGLNISDIRGDSVPETTQMLSPILA